MTTRERHLAAVVGIILGTAGVGFLAYTFVLSPYLEKNRQIRVRQNEVDKLETDILDIQVQKKKFDIARQESLPADVGVSRLQYSSLLEGLIRRADFAPGTYKITVAEADNKTAPTVAPKRPAYTRLSYDLTLKGELYNLVDFMQLFYRQPLLHSIKHINIQRPSDSRAQQTRQLDVVMKIEALVLDNAEHRPTLLPLVRELALLSGAAAQTGFNLYAASGRGSPIPPGGVLADEPREYLAIAGKDMFFGTKPPPPPVDSDKAKEEDHSPFVTLVSITGHDDGSIVAVFRDKLDNHNYTITQDAKGAIAVKGEWEVRNRWMTIPGYSTSKPGRIVFYGSDESGNRREWRVRRVLLDGVILEKVEKSEPGAKPKPPGLAAVGGGTGALVAVPEGGKVYRVNVGQDLETDPKDPKDPKRSGPPPSRYLLTREAWKAIYAPLVVPTGSGSDESRGK